MSSRYAIIVEEIDGEFRLIVCISRSYLIKLKFSLYIFKFYIIVYINRKF